MRSLLLLCFLWLTPLPTYSQNAGRGSFEDVRPESMLVIGVDTSSTFINNLKPGAPGSDYLLRAIDEFRRSTIGLDAAVIIMTFDATGENPIVYEGMIRDLPKRFPRPQALLDFIFETSKPDASHIVEGLARASNYLRYHPGLTNNSSCRLSLLVLSDYLDSNSPEVRAGHFKAFGDNLERLNQRCDLQMGLYFAPEKDINNLDRFLASKGVKKRTVVGVFVDNPPLPEF